MANNGYTGKITNSGTQVVEAVNRKSAPHKKPVVHRGNDLRVKNGNK
jgi:hypothetical protein